MKKMFLLLTAALFTCAAPAVLHSAEAAKPAVAAVENSTVSSVTSPAKKWDQMTDKEKEEAKDDYLKMKDMGQSVTDYLANGSKKTDSLSVEDKKKLKKAYAEWEKLSPHMKETTMAKYKKWMAMPPEQQGKIKEAFKKYKSASPAEKAKIRQAAKDKAEEQ